MIVLHHAPSTAAMAPHILLEELGVPFELRLVDLEARTHKAPDYLRLNPNGTGAGAGRRRRPGGPLVLWESAAICLHLADMHPSAGLAPLPGTPARAQFYKWLMWLTNTLQAALISYFYPERWVAEGMPPPRPRSRRAPRRAWAPWSTCWRPIWRATDGPGCSAPAGRRSTPTR